MKINNLKKRNISNHALKRSQQRGISTNGIKLLFEEGKIIRQKGGTALIIFPKCKKPTIEKHNLKDKNIKTVPLFALSSVAKGNVFDRLKDEVYLLFE